MNGITKRIFIRTAAVLTALVMLISMLPTAALAVEPPEELLCDTAVLANLENGEVLYSKDCTKQIIPASTTKVMTTMLVIEAIERGELTADESVTASQEIIDAVPYDASRVLPYIKAGEALTVEEYLQCIMLCSDCVACDIMAARVSGDVETFVAAMNARAQELGCQNTCFVNTHGYPTEGHYSCAEDLMRIMRQAVNYELFRKVYSTIKTVIPANGVSEERKLYNTDYMIWNPDKITSIYTKYYYPYALGGKTGSSKESGLCLVSCAEKDGVRLVAVVTGAENQQVEDTEEWINRSFSETQKLFEWGFANYKNYALLTSGTDAGTIAVTDGKAESVQAAAAGAVTVLLPNDISMQDVQCLPTFSSETIAAPVSSGDVVGKMNVYYSGKLYGTVDIKATADVEAMPKAVKTAKKTGKVLLVIVLITMLALAGAVLLYVTNNKKILLPEFYSGNKKTSGTAQRGAYMQHAQRQRPTPTQGQRPAQAQGQRPVQAQRQRPVQAQRQNPVQAQGQRPVQGQGQRSAQYQTSQRQTQQSRSATGERATYSSRVGTSSRRAAPQYDPERERLLREHAAQAKEYAEYLRSLENNDGE